MSRKHQTFQFDLARRKFQDFGQCIDLLLKAIGFSVERQIRELKPLRAKTTTAMQPASSLVVAKTTEPSHLAKVELLDFLLECFGWSYYSQENSEI